MYLSKFSTSINEDGALRIEIRNKSLLSIVHVKSWKDGLGLKLIQGERKYFRFLNAESTLLNFAHNKDMDLPIHDFTKEIPVIYIEAASKYIHLQHLILRVFRHYPGSYDLFQSNKHLFDLVIYNHQNLRKTGYLISLQQHKIIEVLYPDKKCSISYKSLVSLLKRIIPTIDPESPSLIDSFMQKVIYSKLLFRSEKTLLHIKSIPLCCLEDNYLKFVFLLRPSLIFKDIDEYLSTSGNTYDLYQGNSFFKNHISSYRYLIDDTFLMAKRLKKPEKEIKDKIFNSKTKDQITRYHDQLLAELRNKKIYNVDGIIYNTPPIPGTKEITPITSYEGLLQEGRELDHCVGQAGYDERVRNGVSYIYAIKTETDRCTLELEIGTGNDFHIRQLRGRTNSNPEKETIVLVENWILENHKSHHK